MLRDLDQYEQLSEEHVRERAEISKSPALKKLLSVADEWRAADCTPVFIIVQEEPTILACVAEETFGKPYN